MQPVVTDRTDKQERFDASIKASSAFALVLKRFGVEMKAVANGDSVTATGRMLTMVKKRFSGALAFLAGSNNALTQLILSTDFSNAANLGSAWNAFKGWTNNFSAPVAIDTTQSPTKIAQEFTMEAACANVVAELKAQELAFEADLEIGVQSVFHEAGDFIGPLQELEHVHARIQGQHGLKQLFNPDGLCTYAHCADKVADLKTAFASTNSPAPSIASPSTRVMVYNSVASASSEAPAFEPRRSLGVEAPHLQCPA